MLNKIQITSKDFVHHPTIYGRFDINPNVYKDALNDFLSNVYENTRAVGEVVSASFDLNTGTPIVCFWIDYSPHINHRITKYIVQYCQYLGLECSVWYNKENDRFRFSIWKTLPDKLGDVLIAEEEFWYNQRH